MLWSGHEFSWETLTELMAAPQRGKYQSNSFWPKDDFPFLMWSISTDILTVLANFLGIHNSNFFFEKHWSRPWQHYPSNLITNLTYVEDLVKGL